METKKRKLFLIPFADLDEDPIPFEELSGTVASMFSLDGSVADRLPVPVEFFDRRRDQYGAAGFLKAIARSRAALMASPSDILLGVTALDLFAPRLNYVFGMADAESAVAVISLRRLRPEFYSGDPDPRLFWQRAVKEAIHELGHIFGLAHCGNQDCIMHFSTSIEETDLKGPGFCDRCSGWMSL